MECGAQVGRVRVKRLLLDQQDSSELPMLPGRRSRARAILRSLPVGTHDATLVCPLCGASVPAHGLRAKLLQAAHDECWQILFTCPTCGLIIAFDTEGLSLEKIDALQGSPWATKLRQFHLAARTQMPGYTRRAGSRQLLGTWIVAFISWMLLIGNFNLPEVVWGVIVSFVIARFTYRFAAIDLPSWMVAPSRWVALGELAVEFIHQLVVQNITLSIRVLRPHLSIKPGIVAIPTALRDDVPLTILGNLMTLTPDTVTMDIDPDQGLVYVHWIEVRTTDQSEAQRMISAGLEEKISRWLT